MPSSHLILWRPLLLPSIFPSIRDFSNESPVHIRWPKYWNFSFSISPSNEYSGLISLKIGSLSLLSKGLSGVLQHHSLKASILCCSAFFTVQLSQLYVTTGKTTSLTIWASVGRVMSLLYNTLSLQHICHSFPAKKQSSSDFTAAVPSRVILEPKKRKPVTTSTFPLLFAMK